MSDNRQNYHNILENKNHLTVASRAHNTIESLENQAQDAFSVERTPPQFFMQRMGQLQIFSYGRGRYNLKNYTNQENLAFIAKPKRFETDFEQQESFVILPTKKKKTAIQVPTFFRIYANPKKLDVKPEQSESISYLQKHAFDHNLIETINDIKINAEGKFFTNKPTLKKKRNLEVEYLVIKAPFKPENATEVVLESNPRTLMDRQIRSESKFELSYNMNKVKAFAPDKTHIRSDSNVHLPRKVKTSFKVIEISNSSKIELITDKKKGPYDQLFIDDQPDLFIEESPAKRYVSVGMESMSFPGNPRNIFCLEVDPNEEIFIPNVYDMLLIQNFWDSLEMNSFRVCLRPVGYVSNKNLLKQSDNKENINENLERKDTNELLPEKKEEEKKEDKKEEVKKQEAAKGDEGNKDGKKKKSKFSLKNSIFMKKNGQ